MAHKKKQASQSQILLTGGYQSHNLFLGSLVSSVFHFKPGVKLLSSRLEKPEPSAQSSETGCTDADGFVDGPVPQLRPQPRRPHLASQESGNYDRTLPFCKNNSRYKPTFTIWPQIKIVSFRL